MSDYLKAVWGDAIASLSVAMARAALESMNDECANASPETKKEIFKAAVGLLGHKALLVGARPAQAFATETSTRPVAENPSAALSRQEL